MILNKSEAQSEWIEDIPSPSWGLATHVVQLLLVLEDPEAPPPRGPEGVASRGGGVPCLCGKLSTVACQATPNARRRRITLICKEDKGKDMKQGKVSGNLA